jgi:hypothetical protein
MWRPPFLPSLPQVLAEWLRAGFSNVGIFSQIPADIKERVRIVPLAPADSSIVF